MDSPRNVHETTIFSVLEMNVPDKYYLTAQAVKNIRKRATKNGDPFAGKLETATTKLISAEEEERTSTSSESSM